MVRKFLEKYYPPSEALKRQIDILTFEMTPRESFKEAWGRYNDLLKRCPNHNLDPMQQVLAFYKGCQYEAKREMNLSAGGAICEKGVTEALEIIGRLASNDEGWNNDRSKVHHVASTSNDSNKDFMTQQFELIHKRMDLMGMGPAGPEQGGIEDVNYVNPGGNNRYYNNSRPYQGDGGGYTQYGNKVHPNLSYGNSSNTLKPPPGFAVSDGRVVDQEKMTTDEMFKAFMSQTGKLMDQNAERLEGGE